MNSKNLEIILQKENENSFLACKTEKLYCISLVILDSCSVGVLCAPAALSSRRSLTSGGTHADYAVDLGEERGLLAVGSFAQWR